MELAGLFDNGHAHAIDLQLMRLVVALDIIPDLERLPG